MKKKSLKIYFLHTYRVEKRQLSGTELAAGEKISKDDLLEIFNRIKRLPLNSDDPNGRYCEIVDDQFTVIFPGETENKIPKIDGFLTGVFIRRRRFNHPYEEDGKGDLLELELKNADNEIAEATCFMFDIENCILLWQSNINVSGFGKFAFYLTLAYKRVSSIEDLDTTELFFEEKEGILHFYPVLNKLSQTEFLNEMQNVKSFDFTLSGNVEEMQKLLTRGNSIDDDINRVIEVTKSTGGATIEYSVKAARSKVLKKNIVKKIYDRFQKTELIRYSSHFHVKGYIDEESRIIDLVSDKLYYQTEIELDGRYPSLSEIFERINDALNRYKDKL